MCIIETVYIVGTDRCQVRVDEPAHLAVALYLREVADLNPALAEPIPALDPPTTNWPVWARSAPIGWTPPMPATGLIDHAAAAAEWVRWWHHLLRFEPGAGDVFHPPAFRELRSVPAIRVLMQRHYDEANRWVEALADDPRAQREQTSPRFGLASMIDGFDHDRTRPPQPFRLRLTIIPTLSKHAWVQNRDHILITRHLVADAENALDWLRPRILSLAYGQLAPARRA